MPAPLPDSPLAHLVVALALFVPTWGCGDNDSPSPDTTDIHDSDLTPDTNPAPDTAVSPLLTTPFDQPGPHRVGYRSFAYTYTPPNTTTPRTIALHLWYPTEATTGAPSLYEGLLADPDAFADASPAAPLTATGYPVHVHSHGHLGFGATSAFLMRHFASHGWLAIAPNHTGNTLTDNIDPRPAAIYHLRASDISAALDALATPSSIADPGALTDLGRADASRVLLSGHSFGAHTTWVSAGATFDPDLIEAACTEPNFLFPCTPADRATFSTGLRDPRVAAIIPMAGTLRRELIGPSGHSSVTIPILAMSGSEDPVGADLQYTSTAGLDLTWIDLAGACHQAFALGGCPALDDVEAFALISAWSLAFARRHVLDDDAERTLAVLSGATSISAKVTFMGPLQ